MVSNIMPIIIPAKNQHSKTSYPFLRLYQQSSKASTTKTKAAAARATIPSIAKKKIVNPSQSVGKFVAGRKWTQDILGVRWCVCGCQDLIEQIIKDEHRYCQLPFDIHVLHDCFVEKEMGLSKGFAACM